VDTTDFKPGVLVPLWIGRVGIVKLDKMPERPVLIQKSASSAMLRGQMLSFQATHARVQSFDPLLIWQSTRLVLHFRFGEQVFELAGQTRDSFNDHSFALEFEASSREFLYHYGEPLRAAGLLEGELKQPETERPLKEVQTKEESQKKVQPKTQPASSATIEGPTREQLTRVRYEPPPDGIERRKDYRHEIQQDAQISFVSTTITMNCWLIEISMGGCRIYTEQTMNYEVGAPCELRFVKYGQSYLLPAHIQVKNHGQLAGLQFEPLSQRIQQRLIEFIKEL
jgi:hypothetical protein